MRKDRKTDKQTDRQSYKSTITKKYKQTNILTLREAAKKVPPLVVRLRKKNFFEALKKVSEKKDEH